MPDHLLGVVGFLKTQSAVTSLVDQRIYDHELPDALQQVMPKSCIVVSTHGGVGAVGGYTNDFSDRDVMVRCYSYSISSAKDVEKVVFDALRNLRRKVVGDTLIHWSRSAGGPTEMRVQQLTWPNGIVDVTTHWPYVERPWQVLAADIPVP